MLSKKNLAILFFILIELERDIISEKTKEYFYIRVKGVAHWENVYIFYKNYVCTLINKESLGSVNLLFISMKSIFIHM